MDLAPKSSILCVREHPNIWLLELEYDDNLTFYKNADRAL